MANCKKCGAPVLSENMYLHMKAFHSDNRRAAMSPFGRGFWYGIAHPWWIFMSWSRIRKIAAERAKDKPLKGGVPVADFSLRERVRELEAALREICDELDYYGDHEKGGCDEMLAKARALLPQTSETASEHQAFCGVKVGLPCICSAANRGVKP